MSNTHSQFESDVSAASTAGGFSPAEYASMLENIGTNVFVADERHNIVFINAKGRMTLETIDAILRQEFGFGADEVIGKNIDVFHKKPSYQRSIVSNPAKLPHRAEIAVGAGPRPHNVHSRPPPKGRLGGPLGNKGV